MHAMAEVSGPVVAIACILARGVYSGGVSGRNQRADLSAVRADHRGFGADFGVQRAVAEPGAVRDDSAAEARNRVCNRGCSRGFNRGFDVDDAPLSGRRGRAAAQAFVDAGGAGGVLRVRGRVVQAAAVRISAGRGSGRGVVLDPPAGRRVGGAHHAA